MARKNLSLRTAALLLAAGFVFAPALAGSARAAISCPSNARGGPGPFKVEFAVGSTRITPRDAKTIDEVARFAKARYSTVCLVGRADKQGNERANYDLSLRRAEAVEAALVRRGVSPKRITVVGKGEAYGDWVHVLIRARADRTVDISMSQ